MSIPHGRRVMLASRRSRERGESDRHGLYDSNVSSPWEPQRDPSSSTPAEGSGGVNPHSEPSSSDPDGPAPSASGPDDPTTPSSTPPGSTPQGSPPGGSTPYGSNSYGSTPYTSDPYGSTPYGSSPYTSDPYGSAPYNAGPYGSDPYSPAPYAGGPYPPNPYTGAYGPGYQPAPPASGLAIAALVCGILGFFTAGLTSIPAVICGHLAWPDTSSRRYAGHGMTVAGLVLGYVPILGWLLFWLIFATSLVTV